jgi:DNA invertase Pin-like site-specific DNA recombinase
MFWQKKSMAIIGYARTSTRDQEAGLQAQIRDLITAGCAERDIYTEQASSVAGQGTGAYRAPG